MKIYHVCLLQRFANAFALFLCCSCIVFLFSCSSDDEQFEDSVESNELLNYSWDFIYKGNPYSYEMVNGNLICDDETKTIIDEIKNMPNLVTYVDENDNVIYYDNQDDYLKSIDKGETETVKTRAGATISYHAVLKLYRNRNYRGKQKNYEIKEIGKTIEVPDLHSIDWGDRISSFKLQLKYEVEHLVETRSVTVNFYQNKNYQGAYLTFTTSSNLTGNDLKKYPLVPGSSSNWGDKISSLKLGSQIYI